MIPCDNCLILPICKYRSFIECTLLYEWWISTDSFNFWKDAARFVPNVETVVFDKHSDRKHLKIRKEK